MIAISNTFQLTVQPRAGQQVIRLTSIAPSSILPPSASVGDEWVADLLTSGGLSVTILPNGLYTIANLAGTGSQTFNWELIDASNGYLNSDSTLESQRVGYTSNTFSVQVEPATGYQVIKLTSIASGSPVEGVLVIGDEWVVQTTSSSALPIVISADGTYTITGIAGAGDQTFSWHGVTALLTTTSPQTVSVQDNTPRIHSTDLMVSGLVKSVRGQVGHLLANMPSKDPSKPLRAVLKDIQGGPRSDYPFIVITLLRNDKQSDGWLRDIYVNDDNKPVYVTEQEVPIRVTCYGDSASSILTTLRANAVDPWERSDMSRQVGAQFQDYTGIIREPAYLETSFVNTAYMIATFTAVSEMVSSSGSVIEQVTGEGRYPTVEGDANPTIKTFDVDNSS